MSLASSISPPAGAASSAAEAMAEQVVIDIRNRGLVTGDRYLTAEEARRTFRVGKAQINDALRLLADRGMLTRKRRVGTFIGPAFNPQTGPGPESDPCVAPEPARPTLDVVHVLMPMDYYTANVIPGGVFVDALSRRTGGAAVQLHHIPDHDVAGYTQRLIAQLRARPNSREGVVLIRSSRETQRTVQNSGIPAVAFGSVYPDVTSLPSLDTDQAEAGRLAARAALDRGHDRFALIMRSEWRRGDNLLMEGFTQALGEASIGIDRVAVLSVPNDAGLIEHDVAALLEQDTRPTALVCRSRFHAEAALRGVRDAGLAPGRDVLVVSLQPWPEADAATVRVSPALPVVEQVERLGELLVSRIDAASADPVQELIAMHVVTGDGIADSPAESSTAPHKDGGLDGS